MTADFNTTLIPNSVAHSSAPDFIGEVLWWVAKAGAYASSHEEDHGKDVAHVVLRCVEHPAVRELVPHHGREHQVGAPTEHSSFAVHETPPERFVSFYGVL